MGSTHLKPDFADGDWLAPRWKQELLLDTDAATCCKMDLLGPKSVTPGLKRTQVGQHDDIGQSGRCSLSTNEEGHGPIEPRPQCDEMCAGELVISIGRDADAQDLGLDLSEPGHA